MVPLFLIVIIISPALIISLDPEIIIIPSSIIYSRGHQRARTFPLPHPNRVCNCDHYGYPPHYWFSSKFSTVYRPLGDKGIKTLGDIRFSNKHSIGWMSNKHYMDVSKEVHSKDCNPFHSRTTCRMTKVYIKNVIPFYLFSMNAIIMPPLLPTIRPFVFSYDATHSLGTHPFGIKIDYYITNYWSI